MQKGQTVDAAAAAAAKEGINAKTKTHPTAKLEQEAAALQMHLQDAFRLGCGLQGGLKARPVLISDFWCPDI